MGARNSLESSRLKYSLAPALELSPFLVTVEKLGNALQSRNSQAAKNTRMRSTEKHRT